MLAVLLLVGEDSAYVAEDRRLTAARGPRERGAARPVDEGEGRESPHQVGALALNACNDC